MRRVGGQEVDRLGVDRCLEKLAGRGKKEGERRGRGAKARKAEVGIIPNRSNRGRGELRASGSGLTQSAGQEPAPTRTLRESCTPLINRQFGTSGGQIPLPASM